jgi:putative chitinase
VLKRTVLKAIYPRAPNDHLASFVARAPELLRQFGIDAAPTRLHFFLAQLGHESAGLTVTEERLSYSAKRMCQVWPSRFRTLEAASSCAGNPELLANTVYCNRMGNGDAASGDGWRYRGRGYIQLTGRDGYRNVGKHAGLDLETSPELAAMPAHALLVACAFWQWKRLNELCDTNDFVAVTRRINGGINGLADRRAWLARIERALMASSALAAPALVPNEAG